MHSKDPFISKKASSLQGALAYNSSDDFFKLKGAFRVERWKGPVGTGVLVDVPVDEHNLVVTVARRVMSRLIAGAISGATIINIGGTVNVANHPEYLFVTQMRWGTGGVLPPPADQTIPIPPQSTDEALNTPIIPPAGPLYKTVTVSYPTDLNVTFSAALDQTEANGLAISEEGLFCTSDGVNLLMFAHKTFGVLTKTADFSFAFAHTILF